MRALIDEDGLVWQVAAAEFEAAAPLRWVDAPAGTAAADRFAAGAFTRLPEPPPIPMGAVAPLSFLGRFTADEQGAIALAAQGNAQLFLWMLKLSAAREVDLASPETIAGLGALVGAGLLTQARVDEVLSTAAPGAAAAMAAPG